jgi:hypothetical protein
MADLRESFATLEDSGTQEGKALAARQEGDAAASQNGSIGFSFKDSTGNVILPALDAAGNVPVLVDHQDQEGDAAAGKEGLVAFAFKDSTGDLVLPQLNAAGGLPVSVATISTRKKSQAGELAAGSATLANVTNASITLTASKVYYGITAVVCSRRDSLFQLVQVDDATSTVLAECIVGAGQYSFEMLWPDMQITAGATGTQTLKIMAKNFEALSSLRATLTVNEVI